VKIVPVASEVDAEATVCDRLASRIELPERNARNAATLITAAGIEAETVIPTRRPRIRVRRAEHDPQHHAGDDGAQRELGGRLGSLGFGHGARMIRELRQA
jgi:hypothetical protein